MLYKPSLPFIASQLKELIPEYDEMLALIEKAGGWVRLPDEINQLIERLKLLVNEIRIEDKEAQITGSYAALASAVAETKKGTLGRVPSSVPSWLAG